MTDYQHRAHAGVLVPDDDRLLVVHVHAPAFGHDRHWMLPGGGVEGAESFEDCAAREALEETGLRVSVTRLIYVRQIIDMESLRQSAEFYFLAKAIGGRLGDRQRDATGSDEKILDARFVSREEALDMVIWPKAIPGRVWDDLAVGFPGIVDLGAVLIDESEARSIDPPGQARKSQPDRASGGRD